MLKPAANAGVLSISTSDIKAPIVKENGLCVCYIDSKNIEIDIEFKITPESGNGYQLISKRYSCESLTLSPDVGGLTPFENGDGVTKIAFDVNMDTNELDTLINDAIPSGSDSVDLMTVAFNAGGRDTQWALIRAKPSQIWFHSNTNDLPVYDSGTWYAIDDANFGTFDETTGIATITHSLIATATFSSAISTFNGVVFGKI